MTTKISKIILLGMSLLPMLTFAQPLPPTVTPVPLDGGLVALLAAGAVYGAKKYKFNQNNQ